MTLVSNPNVISNGGFGADTTGWSTVNSASMTVALSGTSGNCLQGWCHAVNSYIVQTSSITIGAPYKVSYWAKNGTTYGQVYIGYTGGGGQYASTNMNVADWTYYSFVFTPITTAVTFNYYTSATNDTGKYSYIDSIQMCRVDAAVDPSGIYTSDNTSWNKVHDLTPTHHYRLNEFSGTTAAIHDCGDTPMYMVVSNNPVFSIPAKISTGCQFTGTSFLYGSVTVTGSGDWSVCVWNKSTTKGGRVTSKQDGTGGNTNVLCIMADSTTGYHCGSAYSGAAEIACTLTSLINDSTFHHVAYVRKKGYQYEMWLDGILNSTKTDTFGDLSNSAVLGIGARGDGVTPLNNGAILEDVRIYNRALSQQEISAIYNESKGTYSDSYRRGFPTWREPIFHFKLNEREYTVANNSGLKVYRGTFTSCELNQPGIIQGSKSTKFTGTASFVDCGTGTGTYLSVTSFLSVSQWIKTAVYDANDGIFDIGLLAGAPGNYEMYTSASGGDNKIYFRVLGAVGNTFCSYSSPTPNAWIHLVTSIKANIMSMYIDSALVTTTTYNNPLTFTGLKVLLGTYYASSYAFNGYIQDVRVYDYALSTEDIQNLYNEGKGTLLS